MFTGLGFLCTFFIQISECLNLFELAVFIALVHFCLQIISVPAQYVYLICTMNLFQFMYQIKCIVFAFLKVKHVVLINNLYINIISIDLVPISSFIPKSKMR